MTNPELIIKIAKVYLKWATRQEKAIGEQD